MDHQAKPCLTSLHISNAHFYLAKEMNFCSKLRTGSSLHLSSPLPVIVKCYPFATAKYQLLYWMEPVELNQRAKLFLLTFLKCLKDKQVLTDTQFALGLSSITETSFSSILHTHWGRGPGYLFCCCLCWLAATALVGCKSHSFSENGYWAPWSCKLSPTPASSRQLHQHFTYSCNSCF